MFHSKERQAKIANDKIKDKAVAETRGDAEGVTLGFNTSENLKKKKDILFRKF